MLSLGFDERGAYVAKLKCLGSGWPHEIRVGLDLDCPEKASKCCPEPRNPDNVPATVRVGMSLLKVGDVHVTGACG